MKSNKTLVYYNTNTITFLREADRDKLSTIGHVFGNEKLQKKDSFIKECYKNILVYMMESLLMSGIQMKSVNSLKLQMIFEKVQGRCCNGKNI